MFKLRFFYLNDFRGPETAGHSDKMQCTVRSARCPQSLKGKINFKWKLIQICAATTLIVFTQRE